MQRVDACRHCRPSIPHSMQRESAYGHMHMLPAYASCHQRHSSIFALLPDLICLRWLAQSPCPPMRKAPLAGSSSKASPQASMPCDKYFTFTLMFLPHRASAGKPCVCRGIQHMTLAASRQALLLLSCGPKELANLTQTSWVSCIDASCPGNVSTWPSARFQKRSCHR